MNRRLLCATIATAFTALSAGHAVWAQTAAPRIGVLMLHGKSPGSNQDPNFTVMKPLFERQGWTVLIPDMPWSRGRFMEGNWDKAMAEIGGHVKALRDQGATKIVIVGHSLGVPAALSHAARGGDASALVLLAPGHVPRNYYNYAPFKAVRESIDEARALVAAGKGDSRERFSDINQGRQQNVVATAKDFLSYYDPTSDGEMSVTAPRIPATLPVLTAIGENDSMFAWVRSYYVDKLPPNPKNRFLEVKGGHLDTPRLAGDETVAWLKTVLVD